MNAKCKNLLGLSTQVPAAWVYVSDGTYKEYTYDNTTIQFKKTTNKEVSKLSYKTALTVQALKALGKEQIDDTVISRLQTMLTAEEKTDAKMGMTNAIIEKDFWVCYMLDYLFHHSKRKAYSGNKIIFEE